MKMCEGQKTNMLHEVTKKDEEAKDNRAEMSSYIVRKTDTSCFISCFLKTAFSFIPFLLINWRWWLKTLKQQINNDAKDKQGSEIRKRSTWINNKEI